MTLREDIVALMADGEERTLQEMIEALPGARSTMGARVTWMFGRDMLTRRQIRVDRHSARPGTSFGQRSRSVWTYKLAEVA